MTTPQEVVEAACAASALGGTEDEALLQALRNLWPIIGSTGRRQAIRIANRIKG
jgi:hypothetical protein